MQASEIPSRLFEVSSPGRAVLLDEADLLNTGGSISVRFIAHGCGETGRCADTVGRIHGWIGPYHG